MFLVGRKRETVLVWWGSVTDTDDKRTIEHFTAKLQVHGPTVDAVDWGSRQSQQTRFEVLNAIGISPGGNVLDVGCGLGDFYAWLKARDGALRYTGIDITPSMIAAARELYPGAEFETRDLIDRPYPMGCFDFVFASGVFYLRTDQGLAYVSTLVEAMFKACRVGLAFNCLSQWAARQEADEFYADPSEVLALCRRFSNRLVLRHDYHPADFTIYVFRD